MGPSAWDRCYASMEHPWCSGPAPALVRRFASLAPGRAIDLACGLGRHARFLAESGWDVQGIDFSPVAIELAAAAPDTSPRISFTVGDATDWVPASPVDLVVMSYLHLPVDELVRAISATRDWLAPDGHLLYLGYAVENYIRGVGGPPDPTVLPDIDDLAHAAQGMRVLELAHLSRSHGQQQMIDVLLHAQLWGTSSSRGPKRVRDES